jgi:hypothetical protein
VNKRQFIERFKLAGDIARNFAANYILETLPEELCFSIYPFDDPRGKRGPAGTIKLPGGRFLDPSSLRRMNAGRAAALLWLDGKVPAWINVGVSSCSQNRTELIVRFCGTFVPADENELPPDIGCVKGNELVPFRIRGPGLPPGWRSVELDGRVSLMPDDSSPNDGTERNP